MLQFDRVGQLTVALTSGKTRVGTGYLVAERLVLTAGHVVDGAAADAAIDVTFPAADAATTGRVRWSGSPEGLDAALVELRTAPQGPSRIRVSAVRWGRLTGQRPGVRATAVGFPRALKDEATRVPEQVDGTINPGVAFGERYDVNLSGAHPLVSAEDPSPWAGLSGAALYCDALFVGVVVIDTPRFQSGRLTTVPIWRLLANAAFVDLLRRHGCSRKWESVELAALFERVRARRDSPASLLRADTAVVAFRGREQSLAELRSWVEGSDDLAAMLLVGPGGQGKTRLALKLCEQLAAEDWVAGLVRSEWESGSASRLNESRFPVLAVVDYAETRIEQVRELIRALADPSERVRVLLLARSAGEWRQQLPSELRYRLGSPVVLPPLEDTAQGRRDAYRDAVRDLAPALAELPGRAEIDWSARARRLASPDLSADAYSTILTIELRALTDLLTANDNEPGESNEHGGTGRSADPDELEDVLLDHEQLYWEQTAAREGFVKPDYQPITLKRTVATVTVCGAVDEDEAIRTVARIPGLDDKTSDVCRGLARWLSELYPASTDRYWGSLQPDRVGEHLIGQVTRDKPDLLSTVLAGASEQQVTLGLTVLSRAAAHQPHLDGILRDLLTSRLPIFGPLAVPVAMGAADPEPVLDALRQAVLNATDPAQLRPVDAVLPPQSLLLTSLSVDVTTRLVTLYRPLAEATPDKFLPDLATSLNNQSGALSNVGRREEALAAMEEAVEIRRRLAAASPDAFLPALATSLDNQSATLSDLGRREEALAASEEAVEIRQGLPAASPFAVLPDLANSLNNQSTWLSGLGRREEALAAIEQAVEIRRGLAAASPDAFLPDLATSMNNQAARLSDLGRREEALAAIEQAVEMHRELAAARPDAFLPALATSLNNQSVALGDLGRREEALAAIEEAVEMCRVLAAASPDAFLPTLANSLNNQSNALGDLGRPEEALAAIDEAVDIRRGLAAASPDAFVPDLAMSLNNQSNRLSALGRGEEALAAIEDALRLVLPLLERAYYFLPDGGLRLAQTYLARCEEAGRDPHWDLIQRLETVLGSSGLHGDVE